MIKWLLCKIGLHSWFKSRTTNPAWHPNIEHCKICFITKDGVNYFHLGHGPNKQRIKLEDGSHNMRWFSGTEHPGIDQK